MDTAISQQVRCDLEEYDKWKMVMPRCTKVKIGDKKRGGGHTIKQMMISKNPYVPLEVDNDTLRNYVKSNTVSDNKICDN